MTSSQRSALIEARELLDIMQSEQMRAWAQFYPGGSREKFCRAIHVDEWAVRLRDLLALVDPPVSEGALCKPVLTMGVCSRGTAGCAGDHDFAAPQGEAPSPLAQLSRTEQAAFLRGLADVIEGKIVPLPDPPSPGSPSTGKD